MKREVRLDEKISLTLNEASEYSSIGINKLREITSDKHCNFVFYIGTKRMIKRKQFDEYIEKLQVV